MPRALYILDLTQSMCPPHSVHCSLYIVCKKGTNTDPLGGGEGSRIKSESSGRDLTWDGSFCGLGLLHGKLGCESGGRRRAQFQVKVWSPLFLLLVRIKEEGAAAHGIWRGCRVEGSQVLPPTGCSVRQA